MAFSFDSLAGCALLAVAIAASASGRGLRTGARINLRFAAVMLAAFAASLIAPQAGMAAPVGWLSGSLAATALALSFAYPQSAPVWLSSFAFCAAFVFGVGGALGFPAAGFLGQTAAAIGLLATGLTRFRHDPRLGAFFGVLGAAALLFASLALMDGAAGRATLFFAASLGLLARGLKNPVVEPQAQRDLLIGGKRA